MVFAVLEYFAVQREGFEGIKAALYSIVSISNYI